MILARRISGRGAILPFQTQRKSIKEDWQLCSPNPLPSLKIQTRRHSTRRDPRAYRSHTAISVSFLRLSPFAPPSLRFGHQTWRTEGTSRQGDSISKRSLDINTGRDPAFYPTTTLSITLWTPRRHFSGHCRLGPYIHLAIKSSPFDIKPDAQGWLLTCAKAQHNSHESRREPINIKSRNYGFGSDGTSCPAAWQRGTQCSSRVQRSGGLAGIYPHIQHNPRAILSMC